jgi:tetratricopeptide (TPR) repeat protein
MSTEVSTQSVIDEEAIGINIFTDMLINMSKYSDNNDILSDYKKKNLLTTAIEINPFSQWAHHEIAIHFECTEKNYEDAEKYYLQALELDPNNVIILYNFAKFYEVIFNYAEMLRYYELASENYDAESCLELSKFYKNINDTEKMNKYLFMGIDFGYDNDDYSHDSFYNKITKLFVDSILYLVDLLQNIGVLNVNQSAILNRLNREKDITILNNKIRLFSKLENIIECNICLETKLNIDLHCGHEVCIDCYKQVYLKKCPFCRTKVFYN